MAQLHSLPDSLILEVVVATGLRDAPKIAVLCRDLRDAFDRLWHTPDTMSAALSRMTFPGARVGEERGVQPVADLRPAVPYPWLLRRLLDVVDPQASHLFRDASCEAAASGIVASMRVLLDHPVSRGSFRVVSLPTKADAALAVVKVIATHPRAEVAMEDLWSWLDTAMTFSAYPTYAIADAIVDIMETRMTRLNARAMPFTSRWQREQLQREYGRQIAVSAQALLDKCLRSLRSWKDSDPTHVLRSLTRWGARVPQFDGGFSILNDNLSHLQPASAAPVLRMLLDAGRQSPDVFTLTRALQVDSLSTESIVDVLLYRIPDAYIHENHLRLAAGRSNGCALVEALLARRSFGKDTLAKALHDAVRHCDVDTFRALMRAGANVTASRLDKLIVHAVYGRDKKSHAMLDAVLAHADPLKRIVSGKRLITSLAHAIRCAGDPGDKTSLEKVATLVARGADVDAALEKVSVRSSERRQKVIETLDGAIDLLLQGAHVDSCPQIRALQTARARLLAK